MGTIHRLLANARRKRFYLKFWLTFAGSLAFVSTMLTIAGSHLSLRQSFLLGLTVLIIAVLLNKRELTEPQLSVNDVLPHDFDMIRRTRLNCPCPEVLANQAKQLAAYCYSGNVTIEPSNFEAIVAKNPQVLACLTDDKGLFLGYFDVLPLHNSFAEMFLAGKVAEDQITHHDVCDVSESKSCRYLFISGLAVWNSESFAGRRNASMLVWSLLKYLDNFYSVAKPITFAVAATEEGDSLLHRFRLRVAGNPGDRRDHYKLYSLLLSKEEVSRRIACLPDWSGLCVLDWSDAPAYSSKIGRPLLPQMRHHALKTAT
jgi:hypothetical protein